MYALLSKRNVIKKVADHTNVYNITKNVYNITRGGVFYILGKTCYFLSRND